MKVKLLILFLFSTLIPLHSESKTESVNTPFFKGFLRYTSWNRPLWSDSYFNGMRAEVAKASNFGGYDFDNLGGEYRTYFWGNVGADVQLWSGDFGNGRFGLSVSLPVSFLIWQDVFMVGTQPVINTDYRFGVGDIGFIHRFKKSRFIKNYTIRYSPFKHESTHLGDELTIWRKDEALDITRVNVNYNYTELALSLNDPDGTTKMNNHFKIGLIVPNGYAKRWYFQFPKEGNQDKVLAVKNPLDFYIQYQLQTKASKHGFQGIFSVEVRNRTLYKYPYYDRNMADDWVEYTSDEDRIWCVNAFLGVRYSIYDGYFSKIGLGIRAYHGANPYGQFRNIPNYKQLGFALIFE